ncbi:MAG: alpha/beta fold hydrolase [Bdellovibrionaceae bacterium]|nr:alpha/beta fold hydrolase [Pseudobdellovibrionaceae bacterium]
MDLVFLHGFLGEGSDWEQVTRAFSKTEHRFHLLDYVKDPLLGPSVAPLDRWGRAFGRWAQEKHLAPQETLLVGYSQGGRLALQALESSGLPLRGAILISTNPGLRDDDHEARSQRTKNDEAWAERFQNESWESVLQAWNQQGVFSGALNEPIRQYSAEAPLRAAASLRNWSLARQQNFKHFLRLNPRKTYWLMGERDHKFVQILNELRADVPSLRGEVVPDAGHRVLFDQPRFLAERLSSISEMKF